MAIPLLDLDALAKACEAGDLEGFAAAGAVGWTLDEDARQALLRAVGDTNFHNWYSFGVCAFTVAQAIGLMAEAASTTSGIAITEQIRSLGLGKEIAIAFRHEGRIHFGVRYASNIPMTPSQLWEELKPWYKYVERNRPRLEEWVNSEGIVSVPLVARRVSAERSGAELLAAVVAEPDDVNHRLVYADWLMGQGDAQGELIQLCEQQRALGSAADPAMSERIKQLQADYGERIAGEIAQLASEYTLSRGFVSRIQMAAPTFAKHGERLLAKAPIEELDLKPVNERTLARLATAPPLRKLRSLRIGQIIGHPRAMPFDDLCASPYFESLQRLAVWTWRTRGETRSAFSKLKAPKLESLFLYEVDSSVEILTGLAKNGSLQLRKLEVVLRGRERWKPALAKQAFARLHTLRLDVDGAAVARLFEGARLRDLVSLELGQDVPIETECFPKLRCLNLDGGNGLERGWLPRLLRELPQLELLAVGDMPGAEIDAAHEAALQLPESVKLVGLHLPRRAADPELAARVAQRFGKSVYDFEA